MGDKSCGIPSGSTYPPWLSTVLGIDNRGYPRWARRVSCAVGTDGAIRWLSEEVERGRRWGSDGGVFVLATD